MALVPEVTGKALCQDSPFSSTFLLQCYLRCLERQGHLTMPNDDPDRLLRIIVLFAQQFQGMTFNQSFKHEFGFDDMVKIGFTLEHADLELPNKLESLLRRVVAQPDLPANDKNLVELSRLINLYRSFFGAVRALPSQD